jgi:hypothetical protein
MHVGLECLQPKLASLPYYYTHIYSLHINNYLVYIIFIKHNVFNSIYYYTIHAAAYIMADVMHTIHKCKKTRFNANFLHYI